MNAANNVTATTAASAPRMRALDVFRGATVALMILVNNPGSWAHLYPPLAHAAWHGLTPTDLVFPFFLFAVGNALAIVLPRLQAGPAAAFWATVLRRTLVIFGIGLLLNWSPFLRWDAAGELVPRSLETLRVMGVLQRIALAFGAAALIAWWLGRRAVPWAAAVLLLAYWTACETFGSTGASGASGDAYSLEGFFGTHLDRAVLGARHLYTGEGVPFDPEGLASTLPAVAQVLLGCWAGQTVVAGVAGVAGTAGPCRPDAALLVRLFLWATLLLVLGYVWQLQMPLNKKLWTSSYVLVSTGMAMLALACCLHVVDLQPTSALRAGWLRFFEVFGRNPLFVFVLSGLVPRVLALMRWQDGTGASGQPLWTSPMPWLYKHVFAVLGQAITADPRLASLLFALANLAVYAALAWWLDRRGLFIRV